MFKLFNTTTKSDFSYVDGGTVIYPSVAAAQAAADLMNGGGTPFLFVRRVKPTTCARCQGKGYIAKFGHVEHGVCFRCRGTGTGPVNAKTSVRHPAFR